MRWKGRQASRNIEDRRGRGGRGKGMALGGMGTIIVVVIALLLGADPMTVLDMASQGQPPALEQSATTTPADDEAAQFAATVLGDTERVWGELFQQYGQQYRPTTMVYFTGNVRSGCGLASSGVGPFYCPADQKVYLDLSFFRELSDRFGAPGDFAQAYVIAHEVGHHIQHLLGISGMVHRARGKVSQAEYNELSVRLELQADFLAGVWAHHAHKRFDILEPGDLEEALNAADKIGDDTLQKRAKGYADQESFTHGTSAQRVRWFKLGFDTGDINGLTSGGLGDTFCKDQL
ncbi:KPN_02809 family neutral zinc metallopeptidase [Sulfuriroseicoccus oceanibius]|uniref:Zinc metallopeptidase n=1 Tax=Sulfuriroseicoccus oceanibius TaxID=2707525 RepID=A0A6B3L0Y7_9BACT|nr:neutral zinc metallopeptidase [Sulfuriroseicoccus oceanibius]QQL46286.1 zinc metallopeptidase [Sulfuriroseicoccus oceanibius]